MNYPDTLGGFIYVGPWNCDNSHSREFKLFSHFVSSNQTISVHHNSEVRGWTTCWRWSETRFSLQTQHLLHDRRDRPASEWWEQLMEKLELHIGWKSDQLSQMITEILMFRVERNYSEGEKWYFTTLSLVVLFILHWNTDWRSVKRLSVGMNNRVKNL